MDSFSMQFAGKEKTEGLVGVDMDLEVPVLSCATLLLLYIYVYIEFLWLMYESSMLFWISLHLPLMLQLLCSVSIQLEWNGCIT